MKRSEILVNMGKFCHNIVSLFVSIIQIIGPIATGVWGLLFGWDAGKLGGAILFFVVFVFVGVFFTQMIPMGLVFLWGQYKNFYTTFSKRGGRTLEKNG